MLRKANRSRDSGRHLSWRVSCPSSLRIVLVTRASYGAHARSFVRTSHCSLLPPKQTCLHLNYSGTVLVYKSEG